MEKILEGIVKAVWDYPFIEGSNRTAIWFNKILDGNKVDKKIRYQYQIPIVTKSIGVGDKIIFFNIQGLEEGIKVGQEGSLVERNIKHGNYESVITMKKGRVMNHFSSKLFNLYEKHGYS